MNGRDLIAETHERVLYVRLNRPEKRNALSRALLGEIREVFEGFASDQDLVAAVLTGNGDRSFAAGGDLKDLDDLRSAAEGREMALLARGALDAVRRFPLPVIAALNGDALGGGAELAASCDFRIAAAHARIGFIQGRLAISTAWGGGVDLFRIVGHRVALRLLSSAEILEAENARAIGLFDDVAAPAGLEACVEDFLAPMRRIAPQAQRAFKALANATAQREGAEAVELENFAVCWAHADHWAAHDAFMNRKQG